jgi:hypothetical protein
MPVRIQKPAVNIREKLAELERPIGVNGAALMATNTPQDVFSLIGAGRKNILINGNFQVSQRGDYSSATSISTSTYYLDRWKTDISGVTATIQRQTITLPNSIQTYSAKIAATSSAASSYIQLQQFVEIFPYMQGRTVTFSAWVRSNRQARLRLESTGANYDSLTSHSGNGGWEYITQTLTLGTGLSVLKFGVIFWNSSGANTGTTTGAGINSGDYIEFANYQVEFGKVATEFEHRSYGEELALCQRYCYVIRGDFPSTQSGEVGIGEGVWNGTDGAYIVVKHPVTMRTNPALDFGNTAWYRVVGEALSWRGVSLLSIQPDSSSINQTAIYPRATTDSRGLVARMTTQSTSARFILSSEL